MSIEQSRIGLKDEWWKKTRAEKKKIIARKRKWVKSEKFLGAVLVVFVFLPIYRIVVGDILLSAWIQLGRPAVVEQG